MHTESLSEFEKMLIDAVAEFVVDSDKEMEAKNQELAFYEVSLYQLLATVLQQDKALSMAGLKTYGLPRTPLGIDKKDAEKLIKEWGFLNFKPQA
jgi:hypothetical protein